MSGFTLIEMSVTLALLALLASTAAPLTQMVRRRSEEIKLRRALRDIRHAIDAYYDAARKGEVARGSDESGYPPNLASLVDGVRDARDPSGTRRRYFLRRLPRDPMCHCAERDAASTWRSRSYDSPPDAPAEGADVFDVYSSSDDEALDGTFYRDW